MSPPVITEAPTIAHLLAERFAAGGDAVAIHAQLPDGVFHAITWRELQLSVDSVVGVLLQAGVQPSERVAQLSENRFEWVLVDLACALLQAVHVPLHASLSGAQANEQMLHSGAKILFVSTPEQAQKVASFAPQWTSALAVIGYSDCGDLFGARWRGMLPDLCRQVVPGASFETINSFSHNITPQTLATILYTSGTTGEPKGVMLSHGNLASNAVAAATAFGDQPNEIKLNFLPLSHIFARTCDLYAWLVRGGELVLASCREKVLEECRQYHPTILNGVPYFYDRIYRSLCEHGAQDTPGALQKTLGGAIRFCNSGGAALPGYVFDFFHQQGMPLLEGYGLSESSPVITLSTIQHVKRGAVGRTIRGVKIKLSADGEVLTRGPHVMLGYYQNPAATAEVLEDGWLKTGDLGRIDDDGFLSITGRKKEILVLSNGKNIAPAYLEGLLTADPAIAQAMIVGDGRSYLVALIVPNVACTAAQELLADPQAHDRWQQLIERRLQDCSHHEQVRRFALLPRAFSIDEGELTPKLSLRRAVICSHFAAEIEALYASTPPR